MRGLGYGKGAWRTMEFQGYRWSQTARWCRPSLYMHADSCVEYK